MAIHGRGCGIHGRELLGGLSPRPAAESIPSLYCVWGRGYLSSSRGKQELI